MMGALSRELLQTTMWGTAYLGCTDLQGNLCLSFGSGSPGQQRLIKEEMVGTGKKSSPVLENTSSWAAGLVEKRGQAPSGRSSVICSYYCIRFYNQNPAGDVPP